jgi:hypothetical protein
VADGTALLLDRGVLEDEWTLFVRVALDAYRVRARGKTSLLQLKSAMRVMTIAAFHSAFRNSVMERKWKLLFHLAVTLEAELGLRGL